MSVRIGFRAAVLLTCTAAVVCSAHAAQETPTSTTALAITSFSPAGGPSGTNVTVTGNDLGAVSNVKFNGLAASFSIQSATQILATVPGGATTGPITVTDPSGTVSSGTNFFVGYSPSIYGFSPAGAAPGASVTISGVNFTGITVVRFNGTTASFTVNSTSQIVAVVPAGATTGPISVTNPAGTSTTGESWFYLPPTITAFAPAGGPAGTQVTIDGTSFNVTNGVTFNGVGAWYSVQSNTRLITTVPSGATTGVIAVFTTAGSGSSGQPFFVGVAPAITGFTPAGGPAGTSVTIRGSNLGAVTSANFNGVPAVFTITSDSVITSTVPGGATTGTIVVSNPAGPGVSPGPFYVGYVPTVDVLEPTVGPVGSAVRITGTGYVGATSVRFNGVEAPGFSVDLPTQITATVPAGASTGPITVTNPTGAGASSQSFGVSPRIVSITPLSVPANSAEGTQVTIAGWNFTGVYRLLFNGLDAGFVVLDDQHITAWAPAGVTTGPLTAIAPIGSGTSAIDFEVVTLTPPPRTPGAQWPRWPGANLAVGAQSSDQYGPASCPDSTGGTYIVWRDSRSGGDDLYAQRLTPYGEVAPGWPANGVVVCSASGTQTNQVVCADRVGGLLVAWQDARSSWDIYVQRLSSDGQRAEGWAADGVRLTQSPYEQSAPCIVDDGAGGAIVAWADYRNGNWDIYAQHVGANGQIAQDWPEGGIAVCTEGSQQMTPQIASDGVMGAYIVWQDARYYYRTYIQRITAEGLVAPGWTADGIDLSDCCYNESPRVLCDGVGGAFVTWRNWSEGRLYALRVDSDGRWHSSWTRRPLTDQASDQNHVVLLSDGQGGFYAVWDQNNNGRDVYAQRFTGDGSAYPGWPSSGLAVTQLGYDQTQPAVAPDGNGGIIVTWQDYRSGNSWDIYAQRVFASGVTGPGWPANGVPVSNAVSNQQYPTCTSWGLGGAIVAWQDYRAGNWDIYAQNVGSSSKLGNPEPELSSVRDLPNDQGSHVRLTWQASFLDTMPTLEISAYGIWRQVDGPVARRAALSGARLIRGEATPDDAKPGVYRVHGTGATTTYWEGIGSVLARAYPSYTYVAETFADSTAEGNPLTTYMVDAHAAFIPWFWSTASLAGYSVDNLPPARPAAFAAQFLPGATHLHWLPNQENDFVTYRLHRGSTSDFVPDETNLLVSKADTGYVDPAGGYAYYRLVAVDEHGNHSEGAIVIPPDLVDVPGAPRPAAVELGRPAPNPARDGTGISLGLPAKARVRLEVCDVAGRSVRTLADGELGPGRSTLQWDLCDEQGRAVSGGLFFFRLQVGREVRTQRLVVMR